MLTMVMVNCCARDGHVGDDGVGDVVDGDYYGYGYHEGYA